MSFKDLPIRMDSHIRFLRAAYLQSKQGDNCEFYMDSETIKILLEFLEELQNLKQASFLRQRGQLHKRSNTEFYRAVDKLCTNKGINHQTLAREIGIAPDALSRYLTGRTKKIPLPLFMKICNVLDGNPEELYKAIERDGRSEQDGRYDLQTDGN